MVRSVTVKYFLCSKSLLIAWTPFQVPVLHLWTGNTFDKFSAVLFIVDFVEFRIWEDLSILPVTIAEGLNNYILQNLVLFPVNALKAEIV